MKTLVDVLMEIKKENEKYFKNFKYYARLIKKIAGKELGEVEVFVFGSIVKGAHTPASDIDVLVVSRNMPRKMIDRAKIKAKIFKRIGIFAPFEIHMVDEKELKWYRRFIDKKIMV